MKGLKLWTLPCVALLIAGGIAQAQDEGEETITLIDSLDAELPAAVTGDIVLPESASAEGVENSAFGLETANAARERGADFGAEMAENAREGREQMGRGIAASHAPVDLSDVIPTIPQPPVTPPVP
jgi:hypothetical protein